MKSINPKKSENFITKYYISKFFRGCQKNIGLLVLSDKIRHSQIFSGLPEKISGSLYCQKKIGIPKFFLGCPKKIG